tara:strand:+ start:659 stop:1972 length:1314 start_codon:yes stop_codon:yes gene_type:complete
MILFPFLRRELPEESFIAKYFQSQGEPAIYEEPRADSNPAELLASVQNDPAVIANRANEARLKAIADAEAAAAANQNNNNNDDIDNTTTTTTTTDTGGPVTITSIREYINNGRRMRLTIYSDGTSTEEDIGPADDGRSDPPPAPQLTEQVGDPVEKFNIEEYARLNYTWMDEELLQTFISIYNTNGGEADDAIRELRTTEKYKEEFPGIFREDGKTIRLEGATPELQYLTNVEAYRSYFADYNLNPDLFENKIVQLFEQDVAPKEVEERLSTAYSLLFPQFDAVKTFYVQNYPNVATSEDQITDEAIFASFINEDISKDIIENRVKISQIGGAFAERGVDVTLSQSQRLINAGVNSQLAQQLAAKAETNLPRLRRLAAKYRESQAVFGTSEFLEAEVFADSEAAFLKQQLEAEEEATFSATGTTAISDTGVTGLQEL